MDDRTQPDQPDQTNKNQISASLQPPVDLSSQAAWQFEAEQPTGSTNNSIEASTQPEVLVQAEPSVLSASVEQSATEQPAQPIPEAPTPAPKKSRKPLIISLVIIGILLLAAAAVAVYFMMFTVSKADYKKAADMSITLDGQLAAINKARPEYFDSISVPVLSEPYVDKFKAEFQDKVSSYKSLAAAFADLTAMRDQKVSQQYKQFIAKSDVIVKRSEAVIALTDTVRAQSKSCSNVSSGEGADLPDDRLVEKFDLMYGKCIKNIEALVKSEIPEVAYASSINLKRLELLRGVMDEMQAAIIAKDEKAAEAITSKAQSQISQVDKSDEKMAEFEKQVEKNNPAPELRQLKSYLQDKSK